MTGIERLSVPAVDAVLGKIYPVLDQGHVRLIDYMGSDASIVQAARVSYGAGTKTTREDQGLINYLVENRHASPLEMVELKFHCKMPIFVARQWVRHRTASINEYSGRYSEMRDEMYIPDSSVICQQSKDNKQGRGNELPPEVTARIIEIMKENNADAFADYQEMLKIGTARELARIVLPLSLYTEWYWKIDLHNLLHFLRLRLDAHAQYEIREYAKVIAGMVKLITPMTWQAFEEFQLHALIFSGTERLALLALVSGQSFVFPDDSNGRKRDKFEAKIRNLGIF